ncbi:MAG: hypothetical protein EPN97_08000 [Alphaproteobacteria bacterium]|nr:MAG: hypothetical protein EPN97_08000 [Alphaproteobacteria bacterium]
MDRKFREEREKALEEIHKAMTQKIQDLVAWSRAFMQGKEQLTLPDHMRVQETFRWPAAVMFAASDLKEDKMLKEVFSRVSARYQAKDIRQVIGLSEDLTRSPAAKTDGRLSAFEDVLKVLEVAERDFDLTYRPLTPDSLEFWKRRHPIDPQGLELAYRENQRHFMKESLKDMRETLVALRDKAPKPAAPKPPKP